jgi:hypothetical protein
VAAFSIQGLGLAKYTALSLADRKTVCDVVQALAVAASVKARG